MVNLIVVCRSRLGTALQALRAASPRTVDLFVLTLSAIAYVFPSLVGLTTYPPYYEDEGWVYAAVFETLRGNLAHWGAFGEGHQPFIAFTLLMLAPVALSVFGPEVTTRVISLAVGLGAMFGTYALARRVAPRSAILAPVLFVIVPLTYVTSKYGRTDFVAIALGLWSLVALCSARTIAGSLCAALAICVQPIMIWLAVPFAAVVLKPPLDIVRLAGVFLVVATIALVQGAWLGLHWNDAQSILSKYAMTSSVQLGTLPMGAVFHSLADEGARYVAYVKGLSALDRISQTLVLGVPAFMGIIVAFRSRQPLALALAAFSALSLALLVGRKLEPYLVFTMPYLFLLAVLGASLLPRRAIVTIAVLTLVATGWRQTDAAFGTRGDPLVGEVTRKLAEVLPSGAVVFSPLVYAGLIQRRPDLRFYSYHALAEPGRRWRIGASCDEILARLGNVVAQDRRETPPRNGVTIDNPPVYLVQHSMGLAPYLALIFVNASGSEVACLSEGDRIIVRSGRQCSRHAGGSCPETPIVRRSLSSAP